MDSSEDVTAIIPRNLETTLAEFMIETRDRLQALEESVHVSHDTRIAKNERMLSLHARLMARFRADLNAQSKGLERVEERYAHLSKQLDSLSSDVSRCTDVGTANKGTLDHIQRSLNRLVEIHESRSTVIVDLQEPREK